MDDEEFEFFVVAGGDEFIHLLLVEAAGDFEQFLEDGDGMYLAPENRVSIW